MRVKMWLITENLKCAITSVKDIKIHCEILNKMYGRKPLTLRLQDNNCCYEIDFDSNETGESVVVK